MEKDDTMAQAVPAVEQETPAPEKAALEDAEEERRAFIERDARAFRRQYPQVDLRELDADPLFRLFCGSRYGAEPLSDLYGDYLALWELAARESRRSDSRALRATGSGGSGGAEALTSAQQRELSDWNRAYPHMKMTAREYLERG